MLNIESILNTSYKSVEMIVKIAFLLGFSSIKSQRESERTESGREEESGREDGRRGEGGRTGEDGRRGKEVSLLFC